MHIPSKKVLEEEEEAFDRTQTRPDRSLTRAEEAGVRDIDTPTRATCPTWPISPRTLTGRLLNPPKQGIPTLHQTLVYYPRRLRATAGMGMARRHLERLVGARRLMNLPQLRH